MNDINNGFDRHLDPPDEIDQEYCESCGQPMELTDKGYIDWDCVNQFCPEKFEKYKGGTIAVVLDMSNHLAEVEQELADLKVKYQQLKNITLFQRSSTNLTQSQQGEEQ